MRKVIVSEFVSLDGVVEAPDQWHFPYWSDQMGQEIGAAMDQVGAGRDPGACLRQSLQPAAPR